MTQAEKKKFRMSKEWKAFRQKLRKAHCATDYVTKQPLTRSWNLHHLDLRNKNYTNISDTRRFLPLNERTHEIVHWLYPLWLNNRRVMSRLEDVFRRMDEYSHDNTEES